MNIGRMNDILGYVPLGVGVLMFLFLFVQHRKERVTRALLRKTTWWLLGFLAVFVILKIILQYFIFKGDPFTKLLLPPHQSIAWFSYSMLFKHVAPLLLALGAGALMYAVVKAIDRWYRKEMFQEHDGWLFLLAALAVGWPNFVLYLTLVFALTVFYSLFTSIGAKNFGERIVISPMLIIAIPIVLVFGNTVGQHLKLYLLTI